MTRIARSFLVPTLALLPLATAQEAPPPPAPELKKLEPMIGNWTGSGTMTMPGGQPTKWNARGTLRWALDGHFMQWDFISAFDGVPVPVVFRAYVGWDRENKRYVDAMSNNAGEAMLHEVSLLPDGTMLHLMPRNQGGQQYAERWRLKVNGDTMTYAIDVLMSQGTSQTFVDGTFKRGGEAFDGRFDVPPWLGAKPHDAIAKLCRSAGAYDVKGEMLMAADQPAVKITGTDTFRAVFGGTVLHGHTDGAAEGMPGKYVGEVFWGHDAVKNRVTGIYVSNFGEVMQLDAWWAGDKLISVSAGPWMGQPTAQRMVMEFDAAGAATRATNHSIVGGGPPFESFRGTYAKKN